MPCFPRRAARSPAPPRRSAIWTPANEALPAAEETQIAIGIGYGSVLDVGDGHLYGDEMNLAFKLGEDLGTAQEVLLTPAARTEPRRGPTGASRSAATTCRACTSPPIVC